MLRATLLALALVGVPSPAALAANVLPGVGPVAVAGDLGGATLAVPGLAGAAYRVHWLSNPWRLAVDLRGHWLGAPESSIALGQGLVTRIRAARHGAGLTRVVFDLRAPADLRTENRGGDLVFIVTPRRAAAAPQPRPYAPPYAGPYAPPQAVAMPTPRPVPMYPAYPGYAGYLPPAPRVTPRPVMPPGVWAQPAPPAHTYPAPQAVPQAPAAPLPVYPPSAPPVAMAPPPQAPAAPPVAAPAGPPPVAAPVPAPMPGDDNPFADEVVVEPRAFFGSRAYVSPGLAVGLSETYRAGNAEVTAGLAPNVELGLDQMFTPMFGLHLGLRSQGYAFTDQAVGPVLNRRRTRDELEVRLGGRARFDVGAGVELFAQPQLALRNVTVGTTVAGVAPVEGFETFNDYLSASHLGLGGGLGLGVGVPFNETFGLALTGEVNFLAGGSGPTQPIYPLLNAGGGLEARLNFSGFGLCLGYKLATLSGANDYSWLSHGPALTLGYNY
ncbi:MAG: AMIN domain-containing protein [Candidatus Sericytochromatia bacterium]|nr:AMIN domain-containing protein [Candidatus Sericytochromatia bacterium]